jgi:Trm5-related predicted tRNA methylase
MTYEEIENWQAVHYRMDNEGIDYCFEHYSNWEEIEDEEFHKLRLEFLSSMDKIRKYVKDKIENAEEDLKEINKNINQIKETIGSRLKQKIFFIFIFLF